MRGYSRNGIPSFVFFGSVLIFITTILCGIGRSDVLIAPNDPGINYYGRVDFSTPEKPVYNWSGVIIEAAFPGPTIGMNIDHSNSFYDIEIDGKPDTTISVGSKKQFIFKKNLSKELHTVRIILRSEDHYTLGTFLGLYLADGKKLASAPPKPSRKIEFIGDSYTAGYGIESTSRSCSEQELHRNTNVNKTFAMRVTKAFHAQSQILAWSGAGVVRNYGEPAKRSAEPYPTYYDLLLGKGSTKKWDFKQWTPDLVVICLGTNDYSTDPQPDDSMYIGDYHKLIARIIGNYPDAAIACVATDDATIIKKVKTVVTEENGSLAHTQVFGAGFPKTMELTGCDWHPSLTDNKNISALLIDTVMKRLDWDTTAVSAVAVSESPFRTLNRVTIEQQHRQLVLKSADYEGRTVYLTDIRGKRIRTADFVSECCMVPTTGLSSGIYCVGNGQIGWQSVSIRR